MIGGYLVDIIHDVKEGLKWGAFAAFFGFLFALISNEWLVLTGIFLANIGIAILFIFAILHIAVLFPVATDVKDNTFMLLQAVPFYWSLLFFFSGYIYSVVGELFNVVLPMFFFAAAIFLVFYSKEIGYSIGDGESKNEDGNKAERPLWEILFALTAFFAIIKFAVNYFRKFGIGEYDVLGIIPVELITYIPALVLIPLTLIVWAFLKMAEYRPRQIDKAILGLLLLLGVFILEFIVRKSGSWELDQVSDYLAIFIEQLLFLPIILSIITHLNFSEKAGLWLGILLGAPTIIVQLMQLFVAPRVGTTVMSGIAAFLLVTVLIFLRENKTYISDLFNLDESNQEEDEDLTGDPMEHLVGK